MGIELVGILYWWKQLCIKVLQLFKLIKVSCYCGSYVLFKFGFGKLALVSDVLCEFIHVVSKYTAFGWELLIIARFLLKGGSILEIDKNSEAGSRLTLWTGTTGWFISWVGNWVFNQLLLLSSSVWFSWTAIANCDLLRWSPQISDASSRYSASSIVASASFWRISYNYQVHVDPSST